MNFLGKRLFVSGGVAPSATCGCNSLLPQSYRRCLKVGLARPESEKKGGANLSKTVPLPPCSCVGEGIQCAAIAVLPLEGSPKRQRLRRSDRAPRDDTVRRGSASQRRKIVQLHRSLRGRDRHEANTARTFLALRCHGGGPWSAYRMRTREQSGTLHVQHPV